MIFKRIKAFTLIETIVTLTIICLLVLMPTLYVKNIKEQIILDSTTRQIRSTINKYLHLSTVEKKSYFLSYFDNNSSIQIMEPHQVSKVYLNRHVRVLILIIYILAIAEPYRREQLLLRVEAKKRKLKYR